MAVYVYLHGQLRRFLDAGFEENKHPRAENGQFGTGSNSEGKPNSPHHKPPVSIYEHKGRADLAAQGLKSKHKGEGDNRTDAALVAWRHAEKTGKPATVALGGRGWTVVREGDKIPPGTPHMVVTPKGELHAYEGEKWLP